MNWDARQTREPLRRCHCGRLFRSDFDTVCSRCDDLRCPGCDESIFNDEGSCDYLGEQWHPTCADRHADARREDMIEAECKGGC